MVSNFSQLTRVGGVNGVLEVVQVGVASYAAITVCDTAAPISVSLKATVVLVPVATIVVSFEPESTILRPVASYGVTNDTETG